MTYSAEELEAELKNAALTRIARKSRGNKDFKKDSGYWTGGACDWGGSHNLKEDCQRLIRNFNKLDGLKNVEQELRKCTSEQEFNSVKSRSIRQAEELERGLQEKLNSSGNANSVFGICIIWDDYKDLTNNRISLLQSEIRRLKDQISQERYKYYEDLRLLKLEQKKIEDRMKENKRKAQSEKDPGKKTLLLQMIEDDGNKLKENLEKQKEIPTSNLRFDSDRYVSDFIESMKKSAGNRTEKNNGSNSPDNSDSDDNFSTSKESNNKGKPSWLKDNWHPIMISIIFLLVLFYFYYSQEEEPNYYDF